MFAGKVKSLPCRAAPERLAMDKLSSLLGPFIVTKKLKCCEYGPRDGNNKTISSITYEWAP
jgi:hypothetical protein